MLDKNEEHSILVSSIMFCCLYVACVKQMVKTADAGSLRFGRKILGY